MKKLLAPLFLFACFVMLAPLAQAQHILIIPIKTESGVQLKVKATAHSATTTWTNSVPSGATCSGGGSAAVTSDTLYRGTTSGGEGSTPYQTFTTPTTTFVDTNVTPGTTYFYTVTATNCNGVSPQSNEVSGTIPNPLVPNAPVLATPTVQ